MKQFPFALTVVVLIVITYLSLAERPVDTSSIRLFEGADKVVHACMYLGLTWMGCLDSYRLREKRVWSDWLLVVAGAMVFGGVMELLQGAITTNRYADIIDFIANCSGAVVGLLLAWAFVPRVYRWLRRG